jgi:hypothetical protein
MKRLTLFLLLMVAVLLGLSFTSAPHVGAQDSPVPTPTYELTPPFRPTPTGWPLAPFPTVTATPAVQPAAQGERQRAWLPLVIR